jgi:non-ribosomal peptide synthetase component F
MHMDACAQSQAAPFQDVHTIHMPRAYFALHAALLDDVLAGWGVGLLQRLQERVRVQYANRRLQYANRCLAPG